LRKHIEKIAAAHGRSARLLHYTDRPEYAPLAMASRRTGFPARQGLPDGLGSPSHDEGGDEPRGGLAPLVDRIAIFQKTSAAGSPKRACKNGAFPGATFVRPWCCVLAEPVQAEHEPGGRLLCERHKNSWKIGPSWQTLFRRRRIDHSVPQRGISASAQGNALGDLRRILIPSWPEGATQCRRPPRIRHTFQPGFIRTPLQGLDVWRRLFPQGVALG
jgi:hypothetical protein